MSNEDKELLDKHQSNKLENDRGNRQEFVFHGSNLAGRVNIIKQNKDIVKKQVNHTATFVSWTSDTDKAKNIDETAKTNEITIISSFPDHIARHNSARSISSSESLFCKKANILFHP